MPAIPRYLIGVLLLVVGLAALAGYAVHQGNPQGVLLYTPPPGEAPVYESGWRIGAILGLTGQGLLAGLALLVLQLLALGRPEQRHVAWFQPMQLAALTVVAVAGVGTLLVMLGG